MRLRSRAAAIFGCAALSLPVGLAQASDFTHPSPVSENAANGSPQITEAGGIANPHVDAIAVLGGTTYAGGLFQAINPGGARDNVMAFNSSSGAPTPFNLNIEGGQVWAMEADPASNSIYIGGDFKSVNGETASLVKVNAAGQLDQSFNPPFRSGRVNEIELFGGRLFVGGSFSGKLRALNPATGQNTGYVGQTISGEVCEPVCSWGTTSVYDFSVTSGRLAAVGNFETVAGAHRERFFMLDLGSGGASLADYYHAGFDKRCGTENTRRVAYLQGIDFSPSGSHFSVAATGQIPQVHTDYWHIRSSSKPAAATVCDGVGRFSSTDDSKPQWINYTGGDSVWTVADTGAAVYAQGHFKWFDNVDGYASCWKGDLHATTDLAPDADCGDSVTPSGGVPRRGIAALSPSTGLALSWNPGVTAKSGGKALEVTPNGLWVGTDSPRFGSEQHYGIAFAPLP